MFLSDIIILPDFLIFVLFLHNYIIDVKENNFSFYLSPLFILSN